MVTKKSKAKEWFNIISPKIFGEKEIGKTMFVEPESLIGRKIVLSMAELENNFDKFYMKVTFRINKIEGNNAFTEMAGTEMLRDYISRMIVRRIRRIDVVEDIKTKDGILIRVKTLCIISRRIKTSIQTKLRGDIKNMIKKEVENDTLEDFIRKTISDEIRNDILSEARRVYPIRNFEIRKTEILSQ